MREVLGVKTMAFKFNFDLQTIIDLRGAMNENTFLAMQKVNLFQNDRSAPYQSWGRMCAAMDRIEDTVRHINTLVLGENQCEIAFDFYEFINNMYVVVENIKTMAAIFNVSCDRIKKGQSSFHQKCSDDMWFSYVRSLCSVHPTETSGNRRREIMAKEIFDCCARVDWDTAHRLSTGDLAAIVYRFPENQSGGKCVSEYSHKFIPLTVSEFQDYLQQWLDFIPEIIVAIQRYNETKYEEFRKTPIKKLDACKDDWSV